MKNKVKKFYEEHRTGVIVASYVAAAVAGAVLITKINMNPAVQQGTWESDEYFGTALKFKNGDVLFAGSTKK